MHPRLLLLALGKVVGFPSRVRLWMFHAACRRPKEVQEQLLKTIVSQHRSTGYGRDHHFDAIRSVQDFRSNVPLSPYDALEPYMARVRKGDTQALLADEKVLMFALTSGTTASRKTIPITPRYLADYRRGWNRWGLRALLDHQVISCAPILQLAGDPSEFTTEAGIPCGSLSGLTTLAQKRFVRFLYCVPPEASPIKDQEAKLYTALRLSLARPVGMITAANPSTLVAMGRLLDQEKERLLRDLHDGTLDEHLDLAPEIRAGLMKYMRKHPQRAKQLEAIVRQNGRLLPKDVWPPQRMLIGTWLGGSVGPYLRQVRDYYGETFLRDLGLLASEGRMTIPLVDNQPAGVLDITTHYFEFIPEAEIDSPKPVVLGAHEVEEGGHYYMVPTTAAGLYRYDLHDLVRVTGFHHRTPILEFLGKGSHMANLTGEKLSEYQVTRAMSSVSATLNQPLPVYTVAPVWDDVQPYYGVFMDREAGSESSLSTLLPELDSALQVANSEYAGKRRSRRLGPVRAMLLPPGSMQRWDRDRLQRCGGSHEQYKHPCLVGDLNFRSSMSVVAEIAPGERPAVRAG